MTPQSTLLSPSGCFGAVTSRTACITPVPVGGIDGKKTRTSKAKVSTTSK